MTVLTLPPLESVRRRAPLEDERRADATVFIPPSPEPAEGVLADRAIVVALVALRIGTLGLGAAETLGASTIRHPGVMVLALVALAAQSTLSFRAAALRLRRPGAVVLGDLTAAIEVVAGVAALAVVAYATPPALRTTSSFWVEPYTVISAIMVAASARRALLGATGVGCLTLTYLLCVIAWVPNAERLSRAATTTAWTNALSYLPFYVIGIIAFRLVGAIISQTESLRRLLTRLSAERARVAAANDAYRIGHDIPKALLREVRRGEMAAEKLRPWAVQYRGDLLAALTGAPDPQVDLPAELELLASTFAAAASLRVDLSALRSQLPAGTPALLLVEATRELLNNASYHRYGYPATLTARSSLTTVEVIVHNEGPGVDPIRLRSAWARKQNTLHQLEAAGGSYEIASASGSFEGLTVTLTSAANAREGPRTGDG